jgi:hypothetical protein
MYQLHAAIFICPRLSGLFPAKDHDFMASAGKPTADLFDACLEAAIPCRYTARTDQRDAHSTSSRKINSGQLWLIIVPNRTPTSRLPDLSL